MSRDPALILRDVRNGLVSVDSTRGDYGIVVDHITPTVGAAAATRRPELAGIRNWTAVPAVRR
jgi:hypothetical protein